MVEDAVVAPAAKVNVLLYSLFDLLVREIETPL